MNELVYRMHENPYKSVRQKERKLVENLTKCMSKQLIVKET